MKNVRKMECEFEIFEILLKFDTRRKENDNVWVFLSTIQFFFGNANNESGCDGSPLRLRRF